MYSTPYFVISVDRWQNRGLNTWTRGSYHDPFNMYVRLRGLPYIHTCRSYVHAPRDFTHVFGRVVVVNVGDVVARQPIRPILGFWGNKVHKNGRFPNLCLGRRWTSVQNLTPLALSSEEKSVTVHARYCTNGASVALSLRRRMSTLMFTSGWLIRPILGLWEQSSPKWEIACPGRRWTTVIWHLNLCLRRRNP